MPSNFARKLRTLTFICLFTSLAGVIYQLIDEDGLDQTSILVGLPLGLAFGFLELFLFPKAENLIRKLSFTKILISKTLLYTTVIVIVNVLILLVAGYFEGRKLSELFPTLVSVGQIVLILYTLTIYGLLIFFLQINRLLGEGVLWKFVSGKYHQPREEERIFMFLDMKSSTTIAEQLGHVRFYSLLNELFHEISQPALKTKAEIYQYVGDEVVLTWQVKDGLENSNCLKLFFLFREALVHKTETYLKDFGITPQFKAGLHFGKVISAQIGDIKREIVYNGDVLNTTARIRSECSKFQRDFLVSGALMDRLRKYNGFQWEKLETVTLRGKEAEVEIFSVISH